MLNYHAHTDFRSSVDHGHDPHLTFVEIGDIEVLNGDIYSAIISAICPFIGAIGAISRQSFTPSQNLGPNAAQTA